MVRVWYLAEHLEGDKSLEHHRTPPKFMPLHKLTADTGVLYWQLDVENYEADSKLKEIREARGYQYSDCIEMTPKKLPDYEERMKMFFTEHLHVDEENRFVLAGSGYFDIRDSRDQWLRVEVVPGDLLVLPAGIYHRFTLDNKNYIKLLRLFLEKPTWSSFNRPADNLDSRKQYVERQNIGFVNI